MSTPLPVPTHGLVLETSGQYALVADVEFAPDALTPQELLHPDGTFATGLLVRGLRDSSLDLAGFALRLASDQAWLQRRFTCVLCENCHNITISGPGLVGRATESCVAFRNCTGVLTVERLSVTDFEVAGVAVEEGGDVRVSEVTVSGSFAGPRPSAEHSLLIAYLPLLHSLTNPSAALQAWIAVIESYTVPGNPSQVLLADRYGVFGVLVSGAERLAVLDLRLEGALGWQRVAPSYRSIVARASQTLASVNGLVPCQGFFADLCAREAREFFAFLCDLSRCEERVGTAFLLFPAPQCPKACVTYNNGHPANASSCPGPARLTANAFSAGADLGVALLRGVDAHGRALRGVAGIWVENTPVVEADNEPSATHGLWVAPLSKADPPLAPCHQGGLYGCRSPPRECFVGYRNETKRSTASPFVNATPGPCAVEWPENIDWDPSVYRGGGFIASRPGGFPVEQRRGGPPLLWCPQDLTPSVTFGPPATF